MREIKFRAYDKAYERMFTAEILQQASDGMVAAANERLNQEKRFDNYNRCPGGFFIPTKDENMEIMQYTGLKDKNGKEIYDGDIVQHLYEFSDVTDRYLIDYSEDDLSYVFQNISNKNRFIALEDLYDEDYGDYAIEVIGNIYENPELLERS